MGKREEWEGEEEDKLRKKGSPAIKIGECQECMAGIGKSIV